MAERKNHHFVPQFYFRRFSKDGRSICLLRRDSGKTVGQASIKAQASKDNFYQRDEVEKALGFVEGHASEALRALERAPYPAELDDETFHLVLLWLTLQNSRTMSARQMSQSMNDRLTQLWAEMEIANRSDIDDAEKDRLIVGTKDLRGDAVELQLMQMNAAAEMASSLGDLAPLLLENRTNRPFIFCDAPVVLYNAHLYGVKLRGVLGYTAPGLMVILPLRPDLLLMLLDGDAYEAKRVRDNRIQLRDLADVSALNKLQIHAASDCVYFNDMKYAPYVQSLWTAEKRAIAAHQGKVNEAPGFAVETGEPMGDILHSFQPQLPCRLSLSFLKHEMLKDGDFRHLRRSQRDYANAPFKKSG